MLIYRLADGTSIPAYQVKTADNYSNNDIESMIDSATEQNQYALDNLVDRLYLFMGRKPRQPSKSQNQYSFLSTRQIRNREKETTPLSSLNAQWI